MLTYVTNGLVPWSENRHLFSSSVFVDITTPSLYKDKHVYVGTDIRFLKLLAFRVSACDRIHGVARKRAVPIWAVSALCQAQTWWIVGERRRHLLEASWISRFVSKVEAHLQTVHITRAAPILDDTSGPFTIIVRGARGVSIANVFFRPIVAIIVDNCKVSFKLQALVKRTYVRKHNSDFQQHKTRQHLPD